MSQPAAFQTEPDWQPERHRDELPSGFVLLHGQYRIERYLNSGGFGITYRALDSLDRPVVIKECFAGALCHRSATRVRARSRAHESEFRAMVNLFLREARNLARLKHPNIVGVHQVFEDNDTAYMALDLIEGRDLLDIIEDPRVRITPLMVQELLVKILDAVDFMHGCDILHRDISPDNILLNTRGEPVLIDFGSAREEATKASRALTGLLMVKDGYSPQEFYIAGSKQTACSDLYALGATTFHLITGAPPPDSQSRLAAIAAGAPDPCRPLTGRILGYDAPFLAAIDKAMALFPADRIQTARDWLAIADPERRHGAILARLEQDQQIEARICRFITEVEASLPDEPCAAAPIAAPAPEAPPKVIEYIGFDDDDDAALDVHAGITVAEEAPDAPIPEPPRARRTYTRVTACGTGRMGRALRGLRRLALAGMALAMLVVLWPIVWPVVAPMIASAVAIVQAAGLADRLEPLREAFRAAAGRFTAG
ncbi:MAG: serine/threonine protein kinase [Rubellimicrobium sp.]|nr:serine/threonine protein kinase [Rubellimicrobium sp.]